MEKVGHIRDKDNYGAYTELGFDPPTLKGVEVLALGHLNVTLFKNKVFADDPARTRSLE